MSTDATILARTVMAMRPIVPAKDFEISRQFYIELGFEPRILTDRLVELRLGAFSFILQAYYVAQWADNFVMHMRVSDVKLWWQRIDSLDLATRYGVKARAPQTEDWGLVADVIDPSGYFGGSPRRTRQARSNTTDRLGAPGLADTAPNRKSRTRNSRQPSASSARRNPCSHRRIGKRPLASSPMPDGYTADK
jgi:hypothetical protein